MQKPPASAKDRIGFNDDGSLDEIVLTGLAHLEQMDGGSWYLGLYRPDGSGFQVWLSAENGGMRVSHEEMTARKRKRPQP